MSIFFRVIPENITPLWPHIEAVLDRALALSATHDAEDVRRTVMTNEAQLWVQYDAPVVEAVVVSEFVRYPRGIFIRAWLAGALPSAPLDDDLMAQALDGWSKAHKAIGLEIIGRPGWLRRVPGLKVEGLVMRKVFD